MLILFSCFTLPNATEVPLPSKRSDTNRYNPRVIADCRDEDWVVSNQNIVGTLANRRMGYSRWPVAAMVPNTTKITVNVQEERSSYFQ